MPSAHPNLRAGFFAAVFNNCIDCVQNVFSKKLLSTHYNYVNLQFYTSAAALVVQLPLLLHRPDWLRTESETSTGITTELMGYLLLNGAFFHMQSVAAYGVMGYAAAPEEKRPPAPLLSSSRPLKLTLTLLLSRQKADLARQPVGGEHPQACAAHMVRQSEPIRACRHLPFPAPLFAVPYRLCPRAARSSTRKLWCPCWQALHIVFWQPHLLDEWPGDTRCTRRCFRIQSRPDALSLPPTTAQTRGLVRRVNLPRAGLGMQCAIWVRVPRRASVELGGMPIGRQGYMTRKGMWAELWRVCVQPRPRPRRHRFACFGAIGPTNQRIQPCRVVACWYVVKGTSWTWWVVG